MRDIRHQFLEFSVAGLFVLLWPLLELLRAWLFLLEIICIFLFFWLLFGWGLLSLLAAVCEISLHVEVFLLIVEVVFVALVLEL